MRWQRNPTDFLYDRISIDSSGCWNYKGTVNNNGYGQVAYGFQRKSAHRLSWMIYNGPIPKGKFICHICDNKCCINPDHLYCGTHKTNMKDAKERKRWPEHLSEIQIRKLTPEQREKIKDLYMVFGMGISALARNYGVNRKTIYAVIKGETHKLFL